MSEYKFGGHTFILKTASPNLAKEFLARFDEIREIEKLQFELNLASEEDKITITEKIAGRDKFVELAKSVQLIVKKKDGKDMPDFDWNEEADIEDLWKVATDFLGKLIPTK